MENIQHNTHCRYGAPSIGILWRVHLLAFGDGGKSFEQVTCQLYDKYFLRFFGRGAGVHNSLLVAFNRLPAMDSPKLQVAIECCLALEVEYFTRETVFYISLFSSSVGLRAQFPPSSSLTA